MSSTHSANARAESSHASRTSPAPNAIARRSPPPTSTTCRPVAPAGAAPAASAPCSRSPAGPGRSPTSSGGRTGSSATPPYHEPDHVMNIAFDLLAGGREIEHLEPRRHDEVYLDAQG